MQSTAMALQGTQIVGFGQYPVSHRGMASGARLALGRRLRNITLGRAVVM
jgi:hypothetical protein